MSHIDELLARIDGLERSLQLQGRSQIPRQIRLARTVASPVDYSYPEAGDQPNTYWVIFLDGTYTEAAGRQTPDYTSRQDSAKKVAHNLSGFYCPEGTVVGAFFQNGKWWFDAYRDEDTSSSASDSSDSSSESSDESGDPSISPGSESDSSFNPIESSDSSGSGSGSSGSDKSTAIVPASWPPGGYTALHTVEAPGVPFVDFFEFSISQIDQCIPFDPHLIEVCEPGTIKVVGSTDLAVVFGCKAKDNSVRVTFAEQKPETTVVLTVYFAATRKGFRDWRFPDRTREQFEQNERFINSAYNRKP